MCFLLNIISAEQFIGTKKCPQKVSKKSVNGWPMRGMGTVHVISGPMRGLKKTAFDGADKHTNKHINRLTDIATL